MTVDTSLSEANHEGPGREGSSSSGGIVPRSPLSPRPTLPSLVLVPTHRAALADASIALVCSVASCLEQARVVTPPLRWDDWQRRRQGSWWAPRSSKPFEGARASWRVRFPSASAKQGLTWACTPKLTHRRGPWCPPGTLTVTETVTGYVERTMSVGPGR